MLENPTHIKLLVAALSHTDQSVRETAVDAIFWPQPIAAEATLLQLAANDIDEIAESALEALCYFTSKRALLSIHQMRLTGRAHLQNAYNETFTQLFEQCTAPLASLDDKAGRIYRQFLKSVWEVVEQYQPPQHQAVPESPSDSANSKVEEKPALSAAEIMDLYSNPDGHWRDKRYPGSSLCVGVSQTDRAALIRFFVNSRDHAVRRIICEPLGQWGAVDELANLMQDPVSEVRSWASYCMRYAPPDARIAQILLDQLSLPSTSKFFASETVQSYIIHAPDKDIDDTLVNLARNDHREYVRVSSISGLQERKAHKQLVSLIPILQSEHQVTWAVHDALLGALDKDDIATKLLKDLSTIDDFEVQSEIARLVS
jgi:HEAT repeat protein